jgi:hypothetical protein
MSPALPEPSSYFLTEEELKDNPPRSASGGGTETLFDTNGPREQLCDGFSTSCELANASDRSCMQRFDNRNQNSLILQRTMFRDE